MFSLRNCLLALLLSFVFTNSLHPAVAQRRSRGEDVYVKPYFRKDGTFVDGYMRSAPDSVKSNNFSTRGNVNPYTGKPGTKNDDTSYGYSDGGNSGSSWPKFKANGLLGVRLGASLLDNGFLRKYYQRTLSYGFSFLNTNNLNASTLLSVDIEGVYSQKDGRQSRSNGVLLSCRQVVSDVSGSRLYIGAGFGQYQSVDDFKTYAYDGPARPTNSLGYRIMMGVLDQQGGVIELGYNDTKARGTNGLTLQFGFRL